MLCGLPKPEGYQKYRQEERRNEDHETRQFCAICRRIGSSRKSRLGTRWYIYAGGEAGQVYRVDLDSGHVEEIAGTGGFLLGLCLDADGNICACDLDKREIARITQRGEVSVYSNGSPERQMVTPNYLAFDKAGNLYVSDSGEWDQAMSEGCDDFICKPIREANIFDTLTRHLSVRVVYEEITEKESESPQVADLGSRISNLHPDLLANLESDTILGDIEQILNLIDQIRTHDAAVADVLARLAGDFEFTKIPSMIRKAAGEQDEMIRQQPYCLPAFSWSTTTTRTCARQII